MENYEQGGFENEQQQIDIALEQQMAVDESNNDIIEYEQIPNTVLKLEDLGNVKVLLQKYLDSVKFDLTPHNFSTVKGHVKKEMATLNKGKSAIKEKIVELLTPFQSKVDAAKIDMKEINTIIDNKYNEIKEQVAVFENETKKQCFDLMICEKKRLYVEYNIEGEYQNITEQDIDKICILGNIVNKSTLSAKGGKAINELVMLCLVIQNKVNTRLRMLAEKSILSKLDFIIQKEDVAHFLNVESDVEFTEKLENYIANELSKIQKRQEAELERKTASDLQHAQELERVKQEALKVPHTSVTVSPIKEVVNVVKSDKDIFLVNLTLEFPKGSNNTIAEITQIAELQIKKLFPQSFQGVTVEKLNN